MKVHTVCCGVALILHFICVSGQLLKTEKVLTVTITLELKLSYNKYTIEAEVTRIAKKLGVTAENISKPKISGLTAVISFFIRRPPADANKLENDFMIEADNVVTNKVFTVSSVTSVRGQQLLKREKVLTITITIGLKWLWNRRKIWAELTRIVKKICPSCLLPSACLNLNSLVNKLKAGISFCIRRPPLDAIKFKYDFMKAAGNPLTKLLFKLISITIIVEVRFFGDPHIIKYVPSIGAKIHYDLFAPAGRVLILFSAPNKGWQTNVAFKNHHGKKGKFTEKFTDKAVIFTNEGFVFVSMQGISVNNHTRSKWSWQNKNVGAINLKGTPRQMTIRTNDGIRVTVSRHKKGINLKASHESTEDIGGILGEIDATITGIKTKGNHAKLLLKDGRKVTAKLVKKANQQCWAIAPKNQLLTNAQISSYAVPCLFCR